MKIDVPIGDVVDKITILRIKETKLNNPQQLANVRRELAVLREAWETSGLAWPATQADELRRINQTLWDVEDELRRHEAAQAFGPEFVRRARSVYQINDERARVKREINRITGSALVEEKSYAAT